MPLFDGIGYGGEKTAVILDIGAAFTKCGFAGEISPRAIIPSLVKKVNSSKLVHVLKHEDESELYKALVDFIHVLYFRHLLVNPKERRVVVVESLLSPTIHRNTIARVLFKHYEVPSVLFAPSHLVALFTLGLPSGLVLDCGYNESLALPVYEGVPMLKAWEALPLAARSLHDYLSAQLMETCTVKTAREESQPLSSIGALEESIVDDIKVRCCFVTKFSRAQDILESQEEGKEDKRPAPPPSVEYPLEGNKVLHIEGKVRENTCEILFQRDGEDRSVATLVLDAICKCPVDMRRCMAENVVLMGGTAMLPGFKHRMLQELTSLIKTDKYAVKLPNVKVLLHSPPARENYIAWLGGAIFGALEVLGNRSVSRENYLQAGSLPDWCDQALSEDERTPIHTRK